MEMSNNYCRTTSPCNPVNVCFVYFEALFGANVFISVLSSSWVDTLSIYNVLRCLL